MLSKERKIELTVMVAAELYGKVLPRLLDDDAALRGSDDWLDSTRSSCVDDARKIVAAVTKLEED